MNQAPATQLNTAFGTFELQRRPPTPNQPLQAWDAADEYLLEQAGLVMQSSADTPSKSALVINDSFGALALALSAAGYDVCSWTDSCGAHLALAENFLRNGMINNVASIPSTAALDNHPSEPQRYDLVLWRIPKNLALLQQQIAQLFALVDANTSILAGGMIKHLPEQCVELLRQLGRVDILHARKKARLFSVAAQRGLPMPPTPADKPLKIADYNLQLGADANVFAREKFDIGARFFIEQLGELPPCRRIADLGCGNGVLGLVAKRLQPDAEICFFDESYQSVQCAAANYRRNIDTQPAAHFYFDDCLSHYRGAPFDAVLCNPPFHQSHSIGDQIAWRMFTQSKTHLRRGGILWIVGNRHLDYHSALKRIFGNCRQIAADRKFVVLAAQKI